MESRVLRGRMYCVTKSEMAGKELKNFHLDMLEARRKVCSFEFLNF